MNTRPALSLLASVAALSLAACGGASEPKADTAAPSAAASPAASAGGEQTPDAGGKVITVELLTDDQGNNRFDPAEVEAHKGDVVRYTLKTGAHNVHFLPDSNPGAVGLPDKPSDVLQLPGQTYDVKVTFAKGKYYVQCDPHAALGMIGHLEVKE
jgi:plastocyanin